MLAGAKLSNPLAGIVFLGDSQTHNDQWVIDVAAEAGEEYWNHGESSAKVGWALELDTDDEDTTPNTTFDPIEVWSRHKARLYVVWFGLNDSHTSYLGVGTSEAVRELTFYQRLRRVCRICNDRGGAQVALLATQQYTASYTDYVSRNDKTDRYDVYKAQLANELDYAHFITETGFTMVEGDHNASNDLHFAAPGQTKQAAAVIAGLTTRGLI